MWSMPRARKSIDTIDERRNAAIQPETTVSATNAVQHAFGLSSRPVCSYIDLLNVNSAR